MQPRNKLITAEATTITNAEAQSEFTEEAIAKLIEELDKIEVKPDEDQTID